MISYLKFLSKKQTMQNYQLYTKNTQALIYGLQIKAIQRMLDFDYIVERELPSVAAIINPTRAGTHKAFFGQKEILIPIYRTIREALEKHANIDVMINFASFRSAYDTSMDALSQDQIKTLVVIAEGIPERKARILSATAREKNKWLIGPATVGGVLAGQFKIGNSGGTIENIISSKLHRPGSVGFVSKSGGMSNEMYNVIARAANGVYEGIAIGGDAYPGSSLYDHVMRYEANPEIKIIVVLGEIGGVEEYKIVDALNNKKINKPIVAWVTGTCAKEFATDVQFGHAGAKTGDDRESADAKNKALSEAGAIVPKSFNDFGEKIKEVFKKLHPLSSDSAQKDKIESQSIPEDFEKAVKTGRVRKPTDIICSISNDTGDEATYLGEPISKVAQDKNLGLGYVIGLLWFCKKLPQEACAFLEMALKILADHGPCVSGAHNAIVTSRAGKDLISSLVSGLLTIGPRFGGAVDGAAQYFKDAIDRGLSPKEFVNEMKTKGINIPGIGHKIKSVKNPDARVTCLKEFVFVNFKENKFLKYGLEVEKITTSKKGNLILNVDGCIGITFIDMMRSFPKYFTDKDIDEIIKLGQLNGLFVLARSIGIMGHVFDQKRMDQGLYRYPTSDVLYLS